MTDRDGIPTFYRGVRYRSRLEARWACFFALLGWPAHYEPFDLNGWIPDFVLHGRLKGCEQIAVEVKPVSGMDDPLFQPTADKIAASGWPGESLIVSYFLPRQDGVHQGVGWCTETDLPGWCPGDDPCWDVALFQNTGSINANGDHGVGPDNEAALVGYCHATQSFADRIGGYYYGGSTGASIADEEIERLWAQAGNEVQWRRDRPDG
jgi:hypothetical protein